MYAVVPQIGAEGDLAGGVVLLQFHQRLECSICGVSESGASSMTMSQSCSASFQRVASRDTRRSLLPRYQGLERNSCNRSRELSTPQASSRRVSPCSRTCDIAPLGNRYACLTLLQRSANCSQSDR